MTNLESPFVTYDGNTNGGCDNITGGCDLGSTIDFCKILVICLLLLYIFYKLFYIESATDIGYVWDNSKTYEENKLLKDKFNAKLASDATSAKLASDTTSVKSAADVAIAKLAADAAAAKLNNDINKYNKSRNNFIELHNITNIPPCWSNYISPTANQLELERYFSSQPAKVIKNDTIKHTMLQAQVLVPVSSNQITKVPSDKELRKTYIDMRQNFINNNYNKHTVAPDYNESKHPDENIRELKQWIELYKLDDYNKNNQLLQSSIPIDNVSVDTYRNTYFDMRQNFINNNNKHPAPPYYNEGKPPDENIRELKRWFDLADSKKVAELDDYTKNNQLLQSSVQKAQAQQQSESCPPDYTLINHMCYKPPSYNNEATVFGKSPYVSDIKTQWGNIKYIINPEDPTLYNPECNKSFKLGPDTGNLVWDKTTGQCYWNNTDKVGVSYITSKNKNISLVNNSNDALRYGIAYNPFFNYHYAKCAPGYDHSLNSMTNNMVCTRNNFGLNGFKNPKDYMVTVSKPFWSNNVNILQAQKPPIYTN